MSNNKITIDVGLNQTGLDKDFQQLEERLRKFNQIQTKHQQQLQVMQRTTQDPVVGKYAKTAFDKTQTEHQSGLRQQEEVLRREIAQTGIRLQGKEKELSKQREVLQTIDQTTKAYEQQAKAVANLETSISRLSLNQKKATTQLGAVQQYLPAQAGGAGGAGDGGDIPPSPAGGGEGQFKAALKAATAAAIVRGVLNVFTNVAGDLVARPRRMAELQGQAMQAGGRDFREMAGGQGTNQTFWAKERAQAMRMAVDERQRQEYLDTVTPGAKILGGAAAGAIGGSAFAGIGAIPGAIVGAIGGFASLNEKERAMLWDKDKYNKMTMVEMLKNRDANEVSLMMKDPIKYFAREKFTENYQGMAEFERATGVRDIEGMYGKTGLLRSQMRQGEAYGGGLLEESAVKGQVGEIFGAGGATSGAGLAGLSAAMNRQFGVEGTGKAIGQLQGKGELSSGNRIESVLRLILAEARDSGVDLAKMPQELERFTQVAIQMATSGGGYSQGMAALVGAGTVGTSQIAQQAAATAAQTYEDIAKTSTGAEGDIGYGFLLGKKGKEAFGQKAIDRIKADPNIMSSLNQYSAEDLEKDPALAGGLAQMLGYEDIKDGPTAEEQLIDAKREMDANKQTLTQPGEAAMKALGDYQKSHPGDTTSDEYKLLYAKATVSSTGEKGQKISGKGMAERRAGTTLTAAATSGLDIIPTEQGMAAVDKQMQVDVTAESAAEAEKAAKAKGDEVSIASMKIFMRDFADAAKSASGSGVIFASTLSKIDAALKTNGEAMTGHLEAIADQLQAFSDSLDKQGYHTTKPPK